MKYSIFSTFLDRISIIQRFFYMSMSRRPKEPKARKGSSFSTTLINRIILEFPSIQKEGREGVKL